MVKNLEVTAKERSFLESMDLGRSKEAKDYREKYGCDPCDACGPDACADCKACVESGVSIGSNPFDRKYN